MAPDLAKAPQPCQVLEPGKVSSLADVDRSGIQQLSFHL